MAQSKLDAQRKSKAGEGVAAKNKQLEAFSQAPESILTTNQGVVIPDNHNSLRAGARGPTLLEDFILREKLTHFAHERIPERVVGARGCGAHGYFELYKTLSQYTRADFLQEAGSRTPVFVRFSNLTGERGCADTVRDVRGFAVKFYTREGVYDLVGASMPVFFIQDAMKFPDLMHALKPEPHHGMPQASSAHDTFWDFASLVPETTHMLMWLMSGRALPRSLRMMEGFGVHTWRLVNAHGVSHFVKFHWKPRLGRHALAWEEAQKIAGSDPDFHRRDLWEAIDRGHPPEWELGVQLVHEDKAEGLGFDLLDPTKLIPEEMVPVLPVGRLVLNRNPDNFFAETEQVAFNPGHVVPGIDFSHDPLLQGRLLAYSDSQLSRLGGPNGHELPINRGVCPFHNFQRDGQHRMLVSKGSVSYEPNSLASGAEFRMDGGQQGFQSVAEAIDSPKLRRRGPAFDDHFSQATLFWNSQPAAEKEHIIAAFQFELAKLETAAIRQRVVDNLAHVDPKLARKVAEPLGIAPPDGRAAAGRAGFRAHRARLPIESSPALGQDGGGSGIVTRKVAVLVAPGVEVGAYKVLQQALQDQGALTRVVSAQLGVVSTSSGQQLAVDHTFASTSSVLFDAVLVPGGSASTQALARHAPALQFVHEAWRHGKALCLIGEAVDLLQGVVPGAPDGGRGAGVVTGSNDPATRLQMAQEFIAAIARHRHWSRLAADATPA
ncbi:catalase [Ramlibacter tataouinensis]|uniref:Catalase n=1 Tax=Ramlibacter tataouinensis (strain ATCC BAA-407 / DSM 14655 / LMG 21543 / TTB310) TaxID=365046 RepID=F5Y1B9_RAMTT|nr:catalase [Ramlibacter tataouinensis]AEG94703.1 Candidate hydroperoxidase II [Ramlibacter tataouinensis TTB310]